MTFAVLPTLPPATTGHPTLMARLPQRIVCLTEETTETLYLLGEQRRIVADAAEVVRRAPDIIIGSWCGKKFQPDRVMQRPGWHAIPAVRHGHMVEIKSSDILQPGPAALTDGLKQLHAIIQRWSADASAQRRDTV